MVSKKRLFLVEEAVIRGSLAPSLEDPIWELFEDGPLQRLMGTPCVLQKEEASMECVMFESEYGVEHGVLCNTRYFLPASLVQELEE